MPQLERYFTKNFQRRAGGGREQEVPFKTNFPRVLHAHKHPPQLPAPDAGPSPDPPGPHNRRSPGSQVSIPLLKSRANKAEHYAYKKSPKSPKSYATSGTHPTKTRKHTLPGGHSPGQFPTPWAAAPRDPRPAASPRTLERARARPASRAVPAAPSPRTSSS